MFKLQSNFMPAGDQPKAIEWLVSGLKKGMKHQTLLGVTGSGKTFTVANVIQAVQKPTLVIAPNKTLAAQLCNEYREFFPKNSVHYFVSYYDYYQPEAYLPVTDTYIDKEAMINDEIDKLRHAATAALLTRRDVIVVASVSCIYGLGAPEAYESQMLHFKVGDAVTRAELMKKLVAMQFSRTNADLTRGTFRVRGDQWEMMAPDQDLLYRFDIHDGVISHIFAVDPVKGFGSREEVPEVYVFPAKHFVTLGPEKTRAMKVIKAELRERLHYFEQNGKLLEAERLERRTRYDVAMMKEIGYCHGIENYSRHLSGRAAGEPPDTLLSYFPVTEDGAPDYLMVIDESHVTVPQIRGMSEGDAARKKTLIEFGFRLPSAADNRPLKFTEFEARMPQAIYTSATPSGYELERSLASGQIVEQIIRPTGLVDPEIIVRPVSGGGRPSTSSGNKNKIVPEHVEGQPLSQIDDLISRIKDRVKKKERTLVTTLTKKMAEDLTAYLQELKIKVNYVHSDVLTIDRITILSDFRRGNYDVLVGVNLLREGLDLPEVSLVAILDADKEGFLRSETSLIQTIGRAARNVNGQVVLYADVMTGSLTRAISETNRRRNIQLAWNKAHGITPKTIIKAIHDIVAAFDVKREKEVAEVLKTEFSALGAATKMKQGSLDRIIAEKMRQMKDASKRLDFELAAILRDEIHLLRRKTKDKK
ncbi:MAG: excinuclease ABC subunit UvrB [bacterium]|nr:excinuclease ABC subunit UvrB [bacterium]